MRAALLRPRAAAPPPLPQPPQRRRRPRGRPQRLGYPRPPSQARAKRGRARTVDLTTETIDALRTWTPSRPICESDHLFLSLARNRPPAPLAPRALNQLVASYAAKAGLPEDRRTPHVLRQTFCTLLDDRGHGLEIIAELAGHDDVRTTKGYVSVSAQRRAAAVHDTFAPSTTQRQHTDDT